MRCASRACRSSGSCTTTRRTAGSSRRTTTTSTRAWRSSSTRRSAAARLLERAPVNEAQRADGARLGAQRQRARQRVLEAQRAARERQALLVAERQAIGDALAEHDDLARHRVARRARRGAARLQRDVVEAELL